MLDEESEVVRDKTVERARDRLRKPGARLVLAYTSGAVSGRTFFIEPGGVRIADETAQRLLECPDIQPFDSGLLPGHPQSWRLGNWRAWRR
jgi:hypothetical protein